MNAKKTKKIVVLATGGTMAGLAADATQPQNYTAGQVAVADLLQGVAHDGIELLSEQVVQIDSKDMSFAVWQSLLARVSQWLAQDDVQGVVITHGTDTLEETAYFLNLTLKIKSTVVLVGAQRPPSAVSSDGPVNLLAAVRTAIDPKTRGLGVLVVLNDEIQAAREVTKVSTYRVNTFRTPDFGVLGQVDGDQVVIYRHPVRKHTVDTVFDLAGVTTLPRVDIVYAYAGADDVAIEAYVAAGARGLVSAGLPPGIPPPLQSAAFERAVSKSVVVVQASRGGAGRVARRKYLRDQRIVASDNLNAQKCRILLMLALTVTQDPEVVQSYFDLY